MPKKRRRKKRKKPVLPEKGPVLFSTHCPICHTFDAFCVRESRGKKKQHYGSCKHCALLLFGQDAIYTYLREMRYNLRFGASTREDLNEWFDKTLDLRVMQHPVYSGALKRKSIETRRKRAKEKDVNAKLSQ